MSLDQIKQLVERLQQGIKEREVASGGGAKGKDLHAEREKKNHSTRPSAGATASFSSSSPGLVGGGGSAGAADKTSTASVNSILDRGLAFMNGGGSPTTGGAVSLRRRSRGSKIRGKVGRRWDSRDGPNGYQPPASCCDLPL